MAQHGVRVRVLGDLSRLPPEVAAAARRCMAATAHNGRCTLNICLAYTCLAPADALRRCPPLTATLSRRLSRCTVHCHMLTVRCG